MVTSTVLLMCGIAVLAVAVIASIVCVVIGHGKRRKLNSYLKEWY